MSSVSGPKPDYKPPEEKFDVPGQINHTDKEIDTGEKTKPKKDVETSSGGAPMAQGITHHQDVITSANTPGSTSQTNAIEGLVDKTTKYVLKKLW